MNSKPKRKEISHERILETAARAIRRTGYAGTGVADIMKEAGLTHGGFYAHFPSRDALLAAAIERAGQDSAATLAMQIKAKRAQGCSAFRALVESYLSDKHLESPESGCPIAALAAEMPRQSDEVLDVSRTRVAKLLDMVKQNMPAPADPQFAMMATSALVGALQLARALGNNQRGKALLASNRDALISQFDKEDKRSMP